MSGGQNLSKWQTVFFLFVDPMDTITRILMWSWVYHVVHNTCTMHGRNIKTQFLGQHESCNQIRINILSDSIECYHLSRDTPSWLYSECCQDENLRNLIRRNVHVTSTSAKDLMETRMEESIGFRTCSKCRNWATIQKFPIEPTNSKSKSWENGVTLCWRWHENRTRWKKNVPFSGDRCSFFLTKR